MQSENQTHPSFMEWKEMTSLVGSIRTRSLVARPTTIEQCREALDYCRQRGMTICARGAGRGYGDLALNDGNALVDMSDMNRILEFDERNAQITVEAGARLIDIYRAVHHRLLTLPASPTESHSSVAGAICANVNGKEAWHNGSFAHQVVRLTLLLADGETLSIDRSHELFNAVVGGIGMLGIILDATLQLRPIPSPYVEINRIPVANVDALLETMARIEKSHDAAVVWVDAYARGRRIGRSVIHAAKWLERNETESQRREALEAGYKRLDRHRQFGLALHEKFGPVLSIMLQAQRYMMDSFNRLYYTMCEFASETGRSSNSELFLRFNFEASFTVPPAHLVCGPHGYTVQLTFPRSDARESIIELMRICQSSPCPPVTTILRAHKADDCLHFLFGRWLQSQLRVPPQEASRSRQPQCYRSSHRCDDQAWRQDSSRQGPGSDARAVLPRLPPLSGTSGDQAAARSGWPFHIRSGTSCRHRPLAEQVADRVETSQIQFCSVIFSSISF